MNKGNFFLSIGFSSGIIINSFLGLIFYLVVARSLGLAGFGYFSFILSLGLLAAELGDLGFGSSLIKFGAKDDLPAVFSLALVQRLVVSVVIVLVFLASSVLSGDYLHSYAAAMGISLLLVSLISQSLLARQSYTNYIAVNLFGNVTRLILVFFLLAGGLLTVVSSLMAFTLANIVTFAVGMLILLSQYRGKIFDFRNGFKKFSAVFRYSRWLAVSYGVASFTAKIDIPLLYLLGGAQLTGIYSSAQKLISIFTQVAAAIEGIFAPKLSSGQKQNTDFFDYFSTVSVASIGMLLMTIVSGAIIPFIFGSKYFETIPVFNWMLVGMIFFFLSGPFTAVVLYQKGKSAYHLVGSALQLAFTVGLYMFLIPSYGVWGAVSAFILSQAFNFGYYLIIWQYVRHRS